MQEEQQKSANRPADKAELRRELLARRQLVAEEVRRERDERISAHVLAWWRASGAGSLGVYWPIRNEPDLRDLYVWMRAEGARLALPTVTRKEDALVFLAWEPEDELIRDGLGCRVPAPGAAQVRPEALLIPCVGFNTRGQRLGYGGGYYDRTLADARRPLAIGIAYADSLCEFAGDAHDVALDRVITENG